MNDVFEKIGKTLTDTGKAVSEKTKQVGDIAKLNAKIVSSERTISDNYTILGKYYYDNHKDDAEDGALEFVNGITAALDAIDDMKAQILSLKGVVKCQVCGIESPIENCYCGRCGAELEKPEPEEEEEEIVIEVTEEVILEDDNTVTDDDTATEESAE